ncbi:hypothetical protein [Elizabethkingia meningoseptica]|uniref:hypothetical protein n=1 Tax=Elizabethkingia meningoseptica TaxID=238 RepID=UPI001625DC3F|nr:hypothetical protein [Elizabethkingia meningoseptica]HAY3553782.1 hypothetical protein [Elizabethkingia meningoseptica]
MKTFKYKNKYGSLKLIPVSDLMKVSNIKGVDIDKKYKFDINTAEKVALITENYDTQISFGFPITNHAYIIKHESSSTGYICELSELNFKEEINATKEISQSNKYSSILI